MRLNLAIFAVALSLAGCSGLSDRFGDKEEKIAELVPLVPSASVRAAWQASAGSSDIQVFVPAIFGGSVYVAAENGEVTRLDAASGKSIWRVETKRPLAGGIGAGGNLVLVGTGKGEVLAFDADGHALWQAQLSSEVLSPPQVADGVVVARSNDGRVYGLDAATGARKWLYQRALPALSIRAHAAAVLANGMAYVGFAGGKLVAIELATGNVPWEVPVAQPRGATELERIADITSPPLVSGDQVCAVAYQGKLACFDSANGNLIWSREVSSISGLAADQRNLYVVDSRSAVLAFDKQSGASVWKQDKLATRKVGAPAVYDKYLVVGDYQGYLHFLNRDDGSFAARFSSDGSAIPTAPLVVEEKLLMQTKSGGVYLLTTR